MAERNSLINTPLLLVDGHNLLWRAAFGFPARIKDKKGTDLTAVFGFFALLRKAQQEIPSQVECIVCFDGEAGAAKRKVIDSNYKEREAPQEGNPIEYLPSIKAGLDVLGIKWIELYDVEADDVIATLVGRAGQRQVVIFSTDRDYYQLVSENVLILNTARREGSRFIDKEEIVRRYGVRPDQWRAFRALTGDPADGIKGVRGIGPKRAAEFLSSRSSALESIHFDTAALGLTKLDRLIFANKERITLNLNLIAFRIIDSLPEVVARQGSAPLPTPAKVIEALGLW